MNTLSPTGDCCGSPCPDSGSGGTGAPGPKGDKGDVGNNGSNGSNAYTLTNGSFTMPAISSSVTIAFLNTSWMAVGQPVFVQGAGHFSVNSIASAVSASLTNLGYTGNVAPTTVVALGKQVTPAGIKGTDGSSGSSTLNSLSPTTSKGDLIVDNGANNPTANDVRLAVGTNGQMLCADSTAGTGLAWKTVVPVSVTASKCVPRFNGASGTPTPLQDSKMLITDDGALQSTPSGGNARGSKAVDLQVQRGAGTQVASGTEATVSGGLNNTASGTASTVGGGDTSIASGDYSTVGGGQTNSATDINATVAGGETNTASNDSATVGGGTDNTASGISSTVSGGNTNVASGDNSSVIGGNTNTASGDGSATTGGRQATVDKYGQVGHASGAFAAAGDAQVSEMIARRSTTDATPSNLFLDGASTRIVIPLNSSWCFEVFLVGRTSAGVSAMWVARGGIQNVAGTVSMTAACTASVLADGSGGTFGVAGGLLVTADNTNKALNLVVTGSAATLMRWVAKISLVEVTY